MQAFVGAHAYKSLNAGPSVLILFGFEFLLLAITLNATFLRYKVHLIHLRFERWTGQEGMKFIIDLGEDIVRLSIYLVFFGVVFT
jgi:E3 ubiquitin-protein ligase synoviolin